MHFSFLGLHVPPDPINRYLYRNSLVLARITLRMDMADEMRNRFREANSSTVVIVETFEEQEGPFVESAVETYRKKYGNQDV